MTRALAQPDSPKFALAIAEDAFWRAFLTQIDDSPMLSRESNSTANWKPMSFHGSLADDVRRAYWIDAQNAFHRSLDLCVYGTTAIYSCEEPTQSPSAAYLPYEYVGRLVRENLGLERRVAEIEEQLSSVQKYIPTISKMIGEYERATASVSTLIADLKRKSGVRGTLEIARQKDVQPGPYPDWQE